MKFKMLHMGEELSQKIRIADSSIDRIRGLMFSDDLSGDDGLLITPCNSIHTFFMKYNLDIIFLSKKNKIVKILRNMKPWRMSWIYFRSSKVLEMPGGYFPENIREGDELEFVCIS